MSRVPEDTYVETAARFVLNAPADPDTGTFMCLHHGPVHMQLRLPLRKEGYGLHATSRVPDSNVIEYQ
jgi:hypothetical protein